MRPGGGHLARGTGVTQMVTTPSPHAECSFVAADGKVCWGNVQGAHDFCEQHLWALTRENVMRRVTGIILDTIYSDASEVIEGARFVDDLGADSLETVALIMDIEDAFNLHIPDRKVEALQSVGQVVDHVTDVLLAKDTPLLHTDKEVTEAAERRVRRTLESERIKNQILRSELFQGYYELLGLVPERVEWLYRRTLRNERVYKVTPIPDPDKSGGIKGVNILFLGSDRIYHFDLRPDFLGFEWASLNDITLTYEISLDGQGEVSKVVVNSSARDALGTRRPGPGRGGKRKESKMRESLRDATFEFEGEEIEGAMDFLNRFLTNSGA